MKNRHEIRRVKVKGETFNSMRDIVEMMNECFQTVFTRENGFEDLNLESLDRAHGTGLERIQTTPVQERSENYH